MKLHWKLNNSQVLTNLRIKAQSHQTPYFFTALFTCPPPITQWYKIEPSTLWHPHAITTINNLPLPPYLKMNEPPPPHPCILQIWWIHACEGDILDLPASIKITPLLTPPPPLEVLKVDSLLEIPPPPYWSISDSSCQLTWQLPLNPYLTACGVPKVVKLPDLILPTIPDDPPHQTTPHSDTLQPTRSTSPCDLESNLTLSALKDPSLN
jgi:hypothetical protein